MAGQTANWLVVVLMSLGATPAGLAAREVRSSAVGSIVWLDETCGERRVTVRGEQRAPFYCLSQADSRQRLDGLFCGLPPAYSRVFSEFLYQRPPPSASPG